MPQFQQMIERANLKFASTNTANRPPSGAFTSSDALGQVLAAPAVGIALTQNEQTTADAMPAILQQALKAAVAAAIPNEECGIQFLWVEAPGWGLDIHLAKAVEGSKEGMSVVIRSPTNPGGIKA